MRGRYTASAVGKALAVLLLFGVMTVAAGAAFAQETVRTRAGLHPEYGRIVFDWPREVAYTARVEGQTLSVAFEAALATNLSAITATIPDYATSAALVAGGQTVSVALTGPMSVSSFRSGNSVVVDLRRDSNASGVRAAPAQAASAAAPEPTTPESAGDIANAPTIPIRVGEHPDYTRIVFDFTGGPTYRVLSAGGQLAAVFEQAANFNTQQLAGLLPERVSGVVVQRPGDATALRLTIPADVGVRHFPLDGKVVVDVLRAAGANSPSPADAVVLPPAPQARLPDLAPAQVAEAQTVEEPAPEEPAPVAEPEAPSVEPEVAEAPQELAPAPEPEAVPEPEPAPEAPSAEELARQAEEERIAAEDDAAREAAAAGNVEFLRPEQDDAAEGPPLVSYTFEWPEEVGAVVFRRAEFIWVVFDQRTTLDLAPLRAKGRPIIDRIEQLPISGTTSLRFQVPDRTISPLVRREGFDWVVDFRKRRLQPREQMTITAEADADVGPHLIFLTDNPGRVMLLPDPAIGDTMLAAAFKGNGIGMDGRRRYPEFELLASAQGLVMVPRGDDILLDRHFQGFAISAPEGLHISAVSPETPVSAGGATLSARRLFDFGTWIRGDDTTFEMEREKLLLAVGEVPVDRRNEARLEYARFLLAHDLAQEAIGVLQVVDGTDDQAMSNNQTKALRGAALTLAGRAKEALEDWNDPRLDGFAETALWRGAVLAAAGQYKESQDRFSQGESLLSRYPYPLKGKLGLLRIEAALANRDTRTANAWIKQLETEFETLRRAEQADLEFYKARVAAARTDFETATELWEELAVGEDRRNAARAEQNLINLQFKQEDIDIDEAIERLEKLRYRWRGDRFELMVLRRLGELYFEKDDFFEGLRNYRAAVTFFPDDPVAEQLAQKMTDTFRALFLDDEADKMPPLKALALYEEFRELTPSGPDGDTLVEKLGDRLIDVDLLERAANQFAYLIRERVQGEERARLGAKLALVQILDDKPLQAIKTISDTGVLDLPTELQDDRRRILARANFEIDDPAEAIKLLAGDVSREADMLRRNIYWKTEEWSEAARVLQRLTGPPPDSPAEGMPEEAARFAISWAAALHMDGDQRGIEHLRNAYGGAMANSSYADVFSFIVDPATGGGDDFSAVLEQVAGTEKFDAFLTNYREKLIVKDEEPEVTVSG